MYRNCHRVVVLLLLLLLLLPFLPCHLLVVIATVITTIIVLVVIRILGLTYIPELRAFFKALGSESVQTLCRVLMGFVTRTETKRVVASEASFCGETTFGGPMIPTGKHAYLEVQRTCNCIPTLLVNHI